MGFSPLLRPHGGCDGLGVLRSVAIAFLLTLAAAAAAEARCPAGEVRYHDGVVQVRAVQDGRHAVDLVACRGGRARTVAYETHTAHEDISTTVVDVIGGRWVWTDEHATYAESFDVHVHRLTDLRTGRRVEVRQGGDDGGAEDLLAVPRGFAVVDDEVLTLRRAGRPRVELDRGEIADLALGGRTLYWRNGDAARSSAL